MATTDTHAEQAPKPASGPGYDGFISYSHAADGLLAPRLQAALQRFAKPWWKRRALRIFRDESSLSANPHLWESITDALDRSGWFVLLLSPDAAESTWVNQEVEYWVEHHDPQQIIPVLTQGSFEWVGDAFVSDAAPPALHSAFASEPRWVDLRFARTEDQLDLKNPQFLAAVADIASAVRGVPKEDLESEEVRQYRRTRQTAWAAGFGLLVLAIAAVIAALFALAQRNEAGQNADLARARELAASAIGLVDQDPELAILLTLEAIDQSPAGTEQPVEVINALWEAGAANRLIGTVDHGFGGETHVAVSSDGARLLVTSAEGATAQLYDAASLERLWAYTEDTSDSFSFVSIAPGGALAAVSIIDSESGFAFRQVEPDDLPNRIVILDTATGAAVTVLEYPDCRGVAHTAWSPDGRHMVVGSELEGCERGTGFGWIDIYESEAWDLIDTLGIEFDVTAAIPSFTDAGTLFAFTGEGPAFVFEAGTYQPLGTVGDELEAPTGFGDVSPDGTQVVFFTGQARYEVYDTETGELQDTLTPNEAFASQPVGLTFSDDGRYVIAATFGENITMWELETGEMAFRLPGGPASTTGYDGGGELLYTAHPDGTVRVWTLGTGAIGWTASGNLGATAWVNGNSFSVGATLGSAIAIDLRDETFRSAVRFFDTDTGVLLPDGGLANRSDLLTPALPDGRFAYQPEAGLWVAHDPVTGAEQELFGCVTQDRETCLETGEPYEYHEIYVSVGGAEVAAVSESGVWSLLNIESGSIVDEETHDAFWLVAAFTNEWILGLIDGEHLAVDRATGDVLWSSGPVDFRFQEMITAGSVTVVADQQGTIRIIEFDTWEDRVLDLGFGQIRGLAFGGDDRLLAVSDEDHVHIVDLDRDLVTQVVPFPHVSDIFWIDDTTIVVGTSDGVWATVSLDVDELIAASRAGVGRTLTAQECATYRIEGCPVGTEDG